MITFHNPGLIDIRAATTFGVSVKESANPIGFFGTGLKYAIAIILRLGGRITIDAGGTKYEFTTERTDIRGKEFGLVHMNGVPLGFTTHMGANWVPWQAFRELYCNALDEGGDVAFGELHTIQPERMTRIFVECEEIDECYHKRSSIVLSAGSERVARLHGVEVLPGASLHMYYRGILAAELDRPAAFTYNITVPQVLTEDRTIKVPMMAIHALRKAVLGSDDEKFIKSFMQAPRDTFENKLDLAGWGDEVSDTCLRVIEQCIDEVDAPLNYSAIKVLSDKRPVKENIKRAVLDEFDVRMVENAKATLRFLGFDIDKHPIIIVDNLGAGCLGRVLDNNLLVSKRALQIGDKMLAGTMLEEFLHKEFAYQDCTRDFQNYLVDQIMTVGYKLKEATNGHYA